MVGHGFFNRKLLKHAANAADMRHKDELCARCTLPGKRANDISVTTTNTKQ